MGLGSILGKIGKGLIKFIPGVGDVLGGMAKSGSEANNNRDATAASLENTRLGRDKFAVDAPSGRMKNSIQAALAKHATPSSVQWNGPGSGLRGEVPIYSGGRKSVYDALKEPDTQGLMDRVLHDSLMQQVDGGRSGGNTDSTIAFQPGKTSMLDKIIGGASTGGSILEAIMKNLGRDSHPAGQPGTVQGGYDVD